MAAPAGNKYWELRERSGRTKAIPTADEMQLLFEAYRVWAKDNPVIVQDFVGKDADEVERKKERPLTLEGFEVWVGDNGGPLDMHHYFMNYQGRYEDFIPVCSYIKRVIRSDQIVGGMAGIYNPSITQRLNNLVERTENENKLTLNQANVDLTQLSDEALEELKNANQHRIG